MNVRHLAAAMLAGLLLSACTDDPPDPDATPTPTASSTPTPTETTEPPETARSAEVLHRVGGSTPCESTAKSEASRVRDFPSIVRRVVMG